MIRKPNIDEVPAFYQGYVIPLPETGIVEYLEKQTITFGHWLGGLTVDQQKLTYAEGKWTVAEVVGHIIDAERVFAFRIMSIARGEQGALPGFDQNDYVDQGRFSHRDFSSLVDEFEFSRKANLTMLRSLDDQAITNVGNANGTQMSLSSIVYIMAGHLNHHMNIFKEKYKL
ncbi:MAG: DinB family protein [Cyclobacteriaceae bacterium]